MAFKALNILLLRKCDTLRIDKGSRCMLRHTYILLISLMAFILQYMY